MEPQEIIVKAGLMDVVANIQVWNVSHDLGLESQRVEDLGAAWQIDDCIVTLRRMDIRTTEVRLDPYTKRPIDQPTRLAWETLGQLFHLSGWLEEFIPIHEYQEMLFAIQSSFIHARTELPPANEKEWKAEQLVSLRRQFPDTPDEQLLAIIDLTWLDMSKLAKDAKQRIVELETAATVTGNDAVNEFFESLPSLTSPTNAGSMEYSTPTAKAQPLDEIANTRDRLIAKMWRDGHTAAEIGEKHSLGPQSVHNIISQLRGRYGRDLIPLKQDL